MKRPLWIVLALAAPNAQAGCALAIENGWTPPSPPGAAMAAGYGTARNGGDTALTLTGVASPAFARAEMHGGDTRRRHLAHAPSAGRDLARTGRGRVRPRGGRYLMLMRPAGGAAAAEVPISLAVDGCMAAVDAVLPVRGNAGEAIHDHAHPSH